MDETFLDLFSALIWVENYNGTTLMSENHGTATKLRRITVRVDSSIVGIMNNHILRDNTDEGYVFRVNATNGLFANNLTRGSNLVTPLPATQQVFNIDSI